MANKPHGMMAYFDSPSKILEATKAAKKKGLVHYESYTPFPIHGMEDALGLKFSIVPWATLICGLSGFMIAHLLQIWTSAIDWPINVGGKPMVSYPAFIPIFFELTVLLAGLGTAAFMFFLNGMPNFRNPVDPRLTDDRFGLYVPFNAKNGSESEVKDFLRSCSPESTTTVSETL